MNPRIGIPTPTDALDPRWGECDRIHNWRNYISEEVAAMWPTFTPEQRRALARQAQDQADGEDWE